MPPLWPFHTGSALRDELRSLSSKSQWKRNHGLFRIKNAHAGFADPGRANPDEEFARRRIRTFYGECIVVCRRERFIGDHDQLLGASRTSEGSIES